MSTAAPSKYGVWSIGNLSSDRQHLSYYVILEVRGEIIRIVLCCVVLHTEAVHSNKHT